MRDGKKYRILNLIIDTDDNPTTWTDEEYKIITDSEVILGIISISQEEENMYSTFLKICLSSILPEKDLMWRNLR